MKFGNSVQNSGIAKKHKEPQQSPKYFVFLCLFVATPIPLEPDIDSAFEQFGVLAELRVLGTQTLIQQVAGVDNGLDLPGEHAKRR